MYNLSRISILLYYLLGAICLSFYVFFYKSGAQFIPSSIYLLFALLFIPGLSFLFDEMKLENIFQYSLSQREKIIGGIAWILLLLGTLFELIPPFYIVVALGCNISYVLRDGKIFFVAALLCLSAVIVFLLFGEHGRAESASIYVYYFLVFGVVGEIILSFIQKKGANLHKGPEHYEK